MFILRIIIVILTSLPITTSSQNFDIDLLKKINGERNKNLDQHYISLSKSIAPISISGPLTLITIGFIKKDESLKQKGLYLGASFIANGVSTLSIKYLTNRDRPYISYPMIDNAVEESTPSFPSGHTSVAFNFATSLSLTFPKWYVIVPGYIWAGSTAYARMHLGVHYPTDILGGIIIGSGSAYICHLLNEKWLASGMK